MPAWPPSWGPPSRTSWPLGPKGMDKILQQQSTGIVTITSGATILKSIHIDNAAAKVLVDISKTQDDEVGTAPPPSWSSPGSCCAR